ncbi:uncharacterized protein METZ01_LOCUS500755 [marine metagenome]|uniref:Uncharacterized protein n=1 Tax=marine metagenome TaxID=408172 RepID=A0A383DTS5_9ZZZZ
MTGTKPITGHILSPDFKIVNTLSDETNFKNYEGP